MGESLTLLGSMLHLSKSNMLIVKGTKRVPKIGDPVYDNKSRTIGLVYDIIGPISSPYIVIRPSSDLSPRDLRRLKKVYVKSSSKDIRRKRR
ncbi:MAG: H/ACA ribonucleoprotein complex subunit GAR1 [Candidatus Nezhaarchaeales archaeon]